MKGSRCPVQQQNLDFSIIRLSQDPGGQKELIHCRCILCMRLVEVCSTYLSRSGMRRLLLRTSWEVIMSRDPVSTNKGRNYDKTIRGVFSHARSSHSLEDWHSQNWELAGRRYVLQKYWSELVSKVHLRKCRFSYRIYKATYCCPNLPTTINSGCNTEGVVAWTQYLHQVTMTGLIETSAALIDWQKLSYGTAVSALLIVVLLTELLLYVRHARVRAQQRKDLPPGPSPWPIVGNLPAVANGNLQQLVAKFGPLMSLRLGNFPTLWSPNYKSWTGDVLSSKLEGFKADEWSKFLLEVIEIYRPIARTTWTKLLVLSLGLHRTYIRILISGLDNVYCWWAWFLSLSHMINQWTLDLHKIFVIQEEHLAH